MKWLIEIACCLLITLCCGTTIAQDAPRKSDPEQRADQNRRGGDAQRQARPGDRRGVQPTQRGGTGGPQSGQRRAGQRPGGGGPRRGGQAGGGQGSGGQGGAGLFRVLDVDRDGQLSAQEINNAVAVLMRLDTNGDGSLDAQELNARGGPGGQGKQKGQPKPRRKPDA